MRELWQKMNFPDRLYSAWFILFSIALLIMPEVRQHRVSGLTINILFLLTIGLTAFWSAGSTGWRLAHDWYPMLLFIVVFEEVARLSLVFVSTWQDAALLHFEDFLFSQPPTEWLSHFRQPMLVEVLEFGYLSFYWMLPLVGIVLYGRGWRSDRNLVAFRRWMDALAIGYLVCFTTYLLFPTEGPAHTLGRQPVIISGPFRWIVLFVQRHGGVHGNAFPSGHIMAATVCILAALRWTPRLGRWLMAPLLLMCIGAVYDSYHYVSDVVAGLVLGALAFSAAICLLESRAHGVNLEAHE